MIDSAYKITPTYTQVVKGPGMLEYTWDKWYCYYHEQVGDINISRYMHPDGWKEYCYYFNEKREAELAFVQHGWKSLPPTQQEISDQKMMRDDLRRSLNDDFGGFNDFDFDDRYDY